MKTMPQVVALLFAATTLAAQNVQTSGPDGRLDLSIIPGGETGIAYTISYDGHTMLEASPLGLKTDAADFSRQLRLQDCKTRQIDTVYQQTRIKTSRVRYQANELTCTLSNAEGEQLLVTFQVSNNDVAFRYTLPKLTNGTGCIRVMEEMTGFRFPLQTTTFLCPQSDAMIGWKRTKPSYEEEYRLNAPMSNRSQYGHGYTFPALFQIGDDGWVLVCETGVDSRYCGSHLSDADNGLYRIAFPMPEENNGNGTSEPAFSLPGSTPWRTLTVGQSLKPMVETTVMWDVVEPLYPASHDYKPGRSTWSWILWQDASINYEDQKRYIDLAAAMGYEYVLIDNWWDTHIGREKMAQLVEYAHNRGVDTFLWYSSSGYWNDIEQGPVNCMDNPIARKPVVPGCHKRHTGHLEAQFQIPGAECHNGIGLHRQ